ncbi:SAM-dependent methyltransferase [Cryptosporangium aurantiacum]|uniref:S-adenosyl methyltransferase n=1 Tax=Cryptosporangium aurantiacum TaxID=134849 RepID=A0A1M7RDN7_9ACTN|nr:SAM-dependent methyltransferase [Cryptosporangium aurantiacum]SHN44272.1 S-adenosyl methyltransferase [Cryptosporangium aurantiacum]
MADQDRAAPTGIDVTKPSIARAYDVVLGGKDNFEIDRAVVGEMLKIVPQLPEVAAYNRQILKRGVRFLVEEAGIRQFMDLGSGLPTQENTHQIAQASAPESRVVYVDNDPIVLAHGRAILAENDNTSVVTADLRDPETVLANAEVNRLIDFSQPVGVLLVGILHHLHDGEDPQGVAKAYMDAVPSGSYLFMTSFCASFPEAAALEETYLSVLGTGRFRSLEELQGFFGDLEMVPPGLVSLPEWRPDEPIVEELTVAERLMAGGIARKR